MKSCIVKTWIVKVQVNMDSTNIKTVEVMAKCELKARRMAMDKLSRQGYFCPHAISCTVKHDELYNPNSLYGTMQPLPTSGEDLDKIVEQSLLSLKAYKKQKISEKIEKDNEEL